MEMNFCRRCGEALKPTQANGYICSKGHRLYANMSPSAGLVLHNGEGKVLLVHRAIDPGIGLLNIVGGFCDLNESAEATVEREVFEELDLQPSSYSTPQYLMSTPVDYHFGDEPIPAIVIVFVAQLKEGAKPKPKDDVASFDWFNPKQVQPKDLAFPYIERVLQLL